MPESIMDMLQNRVKTVRAQFGKSGYAPLGFSGADMVPIMDRFKGTASIVKAKGVMGTFSSIAKLEKPILSKMAPNLKLGPGKSGWTPGQGMKRLPSYQQSGSSVPEVGSRGGTQIGSYGN